MSIQRRLLPKIEPIKLISAETADRKNYVTIAERIADILNQYFNGGTPLSTPPPETVIMREIVTAPR